MKAGVRRHIVAGDTFTRRIGLGLRKRVVRRDRTREGRILNLATVAESVGAAKQQFRQQIVEFRLRVAPDRRADAWLLNQSSASIDVAHRLEADATAGNARQGSQATTRADVAAITGSTTPLCPNRTSQKPMVS